MKFEIKACAWLGAKVLFEAEIPQTTETHLRVKAALELAVKARADLSGADLSGADLRGAYLRGAYLSGADLSGKTLAGRRPYLAIGPIGSREDYLYAYITTEGLYVEAGFFFGSRDEFADQVREHHGDNEHGQEYAAALALIDTHAKLWTPDAETMATIEREQKKRADKIEKRFAAMRAEHEAKAA